MHIGKLDKLVSFPQSSFPQSSSKTVTWVGGSISYRKHKHREVWKAAPQFLCFLCPPDIKHSIHSLLFFDHSIWGRCPGIPLTYLLISVRWGSPASDGGRRCLGFPFWGIPSSCFGGFCFSAPIWQPRWCAEARLTWMAGWEALVWISPWGAMDYSSITLYADDRKRFYRPQFCFILVFTLLWEPLLSYQA